MSYGKNTVTYFGLFGRTGILPVIGLDRQDACPTKTVVVVLDSAPYLGNGALRWLGATLAPGNLEPRSAGYLAIVDIKQTCQESRSMRSTI